MQNDHCQILRFHVKIHQKRLAASLLGSVRTRSRSLSAVPDPKPQWAARERNSPSESLIRNWGRSATDREGEGRIRWKVNGKEGRVRW